MTDREAMKMALEALEEYCITRTITRPIASSDALRQALAQPEPTPDWEKLVRIETHRRYICSWEEDFHAANLRLTFDGETGKLKSAEVL